MKNSHSTKAKPFIKWVGGKNQLLSDISKSLPADLYQKNITYVEPFVGGGSVLFWMLNQFPNIEKAVINDINADLINVYQVVQNDVDSLIEILAGWAEEYFKFNQGSEERKEIYYRRRELFNKRSQSKAEQAALFIFLNKTCFNGLYRVNKSNLFNVPIGRYKRPLICDEANLRKVNAALQKVIILNGDFEKTTQFANVNAFFYCDPPYKPLDATSAFTSYSKDNFNDNDQFRIHQFCEKLDSMNAFWMLSNSDVKNTDVNNNFFDDLFENYHIARVKAKRSINSKGGKRGQINELMITNYVGQSEPVLTLF